MSNQNAFVLYEIRNRFPESIGSFHCGVSTNTLREGLVLVVFVERDQHVLQILWFGQPTKTLHDVSRVGAVLRVGGDGAVCWNN